MAGLCAFVLGGCSSPGRDNLAESSFDTIVAGSPLQLDSGLASGLGAAQCDTLRQRARLLEQRVRTAVAAEAHDALALNDERREASARHEACMQQHVSDGGDSTGS